jgi:hypothetical protein
VGGWVWVWVCGCIIGVMLRMLRCVWVSLLRASAVQGAVHGRGCRDMRPRASTATPQPLCTGASPSSAAAESHHHACFRSKAKEKKVEAKCERSRDSSAGTWENWSAPDASQLDELTGIAAASTSAMHAQRASISMLLAIAKTHL